MKVYTHICIFHALFDKGNVHTEIMATNTPNLTRQHAIEHCSEQYLDALREEYDQKGVRGFIHQAMKPEIVEYLVVEGDEDSDHTVHVVGID